jgi:hypothetical protein
VWQHVERHAVLGMRMANETIVMRDSSHEPAAVDLGGPLNKRI